MSISMSCITWYRWVLMIMLEIPGACLNLSLLNYTKHIYAYSSIHNVWYNIV